jgi:hypothetical protein
VTSSGSFRRRSTAYHQETVPHFGTFTVENIVAEEHSLPGGPKKKLVKDVRRHLSHYGIRPTKSELWRATWSWADAIARSYWHTHWPMASEIATQYILLLLVEMKSSFTLRLPYRAQKIVPPEVAALLPASQHPNLLAIGNAESKPGQKRRQKSVTSEAG